MRHLVNAFCAIIEAMDTWNPEPTKTLVAFAVIIASVILVQSIVWAVI